jgi:hypothetical protein
VKGILTTSEVILTVILFIVVGFAQGARLVKGTLTASEVTLTVILFIVVGFAIAKIIELFFF